MSVDPNNIMPPQVKVFVFPAYREVPGLRKKYYLVAQGEGEAIEGHLEKYAYRYREICKEGLLSEKVCKKYIGQGGNISDKK
ncbi:MAG: hypothetical protein K1W05_08725 [Desulfovibrio sp.]|jgi:hypothetical protein